MEVKEIKEHEDGSATYQFDMTAEEHGVMCQQGILWCIVAGITGVTPEKVMEAWLDERENKEGVSEATEGSCQEEARQGTEALSESDEDDTRASQ